MEWRLDDCWPNADAYSLPALLIMLWCLQNLVWFAWFCVVQNENAEISHQVENLQKKLTASEEAVSKASQECNQLRQENENTVAKLKGTNVTCDNTACAIVHFLTLFV